MRRARRLLFIALGLLLIFALFRAGAGPTVEPGSVLLLDIQGEFLEAAEPPLVARLTGRGVPPLLGLYSELRKAERDDRLNTVVLRIRSLQIGWGKAQEIRDAILRLRAAGRRPIAYLEVEPLGANIEYYIASAAEEIHLPPGTRIPFVGLAAEYFFLGKVWQKLGVSLDVERVGEYKSAADFLTAEEMPEPYREMANWLLDSYEAQFVEGIASGRGLSPDAVRKAIDRGPSSPEELEANGLIDGTAFLDEIIAAQGDRPLVRGEDYAKVDPESVGFAPKAKFALVYGSGSVVTGEGTASRTGRPVLASETVSRALEDAADAEDIKAIIFRIDSPGGSALASDLVWRATQNARAKKPLIVSFSDVAASGGYYVSAGATAIVAQPGSVTGSIGVLMLRPGIKDLLEKVGIGTELLTRGDHAGYLAISEPLSREARERLGREVRAVYDVFVERVAEGRNMTPERVDSIGRGRVWTGAQAAKLGLVDSLGGLYGAVARAREAANLAPDSDVSLVIYPAPRPLAATLQEFLQGASLTAPLTVLPVQVRRLIDWMIAWPEGGATLIPPVVVDVR